MWGDAVPAAVIAAVFVAGFARMIWLERREHTRYMGLLDARNQRIAEDFAWMSRAADLNVCAEIVARRYAHLLTDAPECTCDGRKLCLVCQLTELELTRPTLEVVR